MASPLAAALRRRVTLRDLRLASGLVLLAYVASHLANHALGNLSLDALYLGLDWQIAIWRAPGMGPLLYGALAVHAALGAYAIYERPRFRWTPAESVQLALGLLIPPLLAGHVVGTRLVHALTGASGGYPDQLHRFFVESPADGWIQAGALVVAWTHGCIGLWLWLRLKKAAAPLAVPLLLAAVLLPVLALLGVAAAGRAVAALAADPAWRAEWLPAERPPELKARLDAAKTAALAAFGGLVLLALVARLLRRAAERRRGILRLTYPSGVVARTPLGTSVLEASRVAGVPHASACGGRGRCSTCRIAVSGEAAGRQPPPSPAERAVLDRIGAGPGVRLACQLRPNADLAVAPLLPPRAGAAEGWRREGPSHFGEERFICAMFVDMRGSTRFAETRLPFDVVFVVNRFLEAASAGVAEAGGEPNQFLGDGLMALFGARTDAPSAAAQALDAVARVARHVEALNASLGPTLPEPIRFGIGLHAGAAILGPVGDRRSGRATFTAIGDPVNVAARLQDMTKALGCEALVSAAVYEAAGIALPGPMEELTLAGRKGRLRARPIARAIDGAIAQASAASAMRPPTSPPGTAASSARV